MREEHSEGRLLVPGSRSPSARLALPAMPRVLRVAQILAVPVLVAVWLRVATAAWHDDTYAFWNAWADGRLYPEAWRPVSEYVYSPAFAQAFWPVSLLPWPVAHGLWAALQLAALVWMLRPVGALAALAFPYPNIEGAGTAVFASLNNGNPMILTAAAITLGLTRWPGAFAFVLLTKVSAGVGLVAFAVRRQWRSLAVALGVTAGIVVVSAIAGPALWLEWLDLLYRAAFAAGEAEALAKERFVPVPLAVRGVVGLVVVAAGAVLGRLWAVPLGCFLALPDIHLGGFAVLTAVPAVWWRERARKRRSPTEAGGRGHTER